MEVIECLRADLSNEFHCQAILDLLEAYSTDVMGGGEELSQFTRDNLIAKLREFPTAFVFLARIGQDFAGLATCFEGFSTFACQPLLNIHDFAVDPRYRRKGVGSALMFFVERFAHERGCCKLTLEVLEGNQAAKALYRGAGFEAYCLDETFGRAAFWQKELRH